MAHLADLSHASGDRGGIVDPRQALTIIETYLRNRGQYIVKIDDRYRREIDTTRYYVDLANAQIPEALTAMRSCLHPARRADMQPQWRQAEAVPARQHDLCIATQHLRRLHLEEGYLGGNFALLSQQMYHLHVVLTLTAGTLDILAGLISDFTGAGADSGVLRSWQKMTSLAGKWANANERTEALIERAARHQRNSEDLWIGVSCGVSVAC